MECHIVILRSPMVAGFDIFLKCRFVRLDLYRSYTGEIAVGFCNGVPKRMVTDMLNRRGDIHISKPTVICKRIGADIFKSVRQRIVNILEILRIFICCACCGAVAVCIKILDNRLENAHGFNRFYTLGDIQIGDIGISKRKLADFCHR